MCVLKEFWSDFKSDMTYIVHYGSDDMVTGESVYQPSIKSPFPPGTSCIDLINVSFNLSSVIGDLELQFTGQVKKRVNFGHLLLVHLIAHQVPGAIAYHAVVYMLKHFKIETL